MLNNISKKIVVILLLCIPFTNFPSVIFAAEDGNASINATTATTPVSAAAVAATPVNATTAVTPVSAAAVAATPVNATTAATPVSAAAVAASTPIGDITAATPVGSAVGAAASAAATATPVDGATPAVVTAATKAAEKMYYCGELYIFTDSMMKVNFEIASVLASLQDYISAYNSTLSTTALTDLIRKYNSISDTYNSWVDVRPTLEKYIETINNGRVYSRYNLQTTFSITLGPIRSARELIESIKDFSEYSPDNMSREDNAEFSANINLTIRKCASANRSIEPYIERSMKGYRSYFDEFASYAGLTVINEVTSEPAP